MRESVTRVIRFIRTRYQAQRQAEADRRFKRLVDSELERLSAPKTAPPDLWGALFGVAGFLATIYLTGSLRDGVWFLVAAAAYKYLFTGDRR